MLDPCNIKKGSDQTFAEVRKMRQKAVNKERGANRGKARSIVVIALAVIITTTFIVYAITSGNIGHSLVLLVIATVILITVGLFAIKRFRDAQKGLPFEDERSRRVMEKATSRSFMVAIYAMLLIGWLSDDIIHFRDVSQATSAAILVIAISFFCFWIYYNLKEI